MCNDLSIVELADGDCHRICNCLIECALQDSVRLQKVLILLASLCIVS